MTLSPQGVYSGTPRGEGVHVFRVTATNALGSDSRVFKHTIQ